MSSVAKMHSAAGSMAGYLFQLDIALLWLAQSPIGAAVGIETLDDVTLKETDGSTRLGQSKLSYTRNLYANGNPNFWKTLRIWVDLIADDAVELPKTEFLLLSNFPTKSGFVAELKKVGATGDFRSLAKRLKSLASKVSAECKEDAAVIIKSDENVLAALLGRIRVHDEIPSHPTDQVVRFAAAMNLTAELAPEVIRGMRGWVLEQAETAFAERRPAWVQKEHFSGELMRLISLHHDNRLVLRTAADIEVKVEDQAAARNAVFVEQMRWVDAPSDELLDAINDYFRSIDERTRLADQNNVSRREFDSFEGRLIDRWKGIHRAAADTDDEPKRAGRVALRKTLDYREDLAGQPTSEFYLTRGTYHKLANGKTAELGWHPEFRKLLKTLEKEK